MTDATPTDAPIEQRDRDAADVMEESVDEAIAQIVRGERDEAHTYVRDIRAQAIANAREEGRQEGFELGLDRALVVCRHKARRDKRRDSMETQGAANCVDAILALKETK